MLLAAAIERLSTKGISLEQILDDPTVQRDVLALLDQRMSVNQFVRRIRIKQGQKTAAHSASDRE